MHRVNSTIVATAAFQHFEAFLVAEAITFRHLHVIAYQRRHLDLIFGTATKLLYMLISQGVWLGTCYAGAGSQTQ